jgi:autotransporter-associated beta strand protein
VDFTNRTVGTGALQVRWTGDGGFAAYGAPQAVKFQTASINWVAANFISSANNLILGAQDSDATLIWQQPFSLAGGARTIQVNDGSAAIDAKMTGSIAGGSVGTYVNHFIKTGGGTLALAVQPTYRGNTTVSDGTLMLGDGTGDTGGVSLNTTNILVSGGATLAVNRTGTLTQGGSALPAAILGDGEFAQVGPGTTVLTLSNEYAGPTTISSGTLQLGTSEVIPDGAGNGNVSLDGTLDLNTFSETINGLSGTGMVNTVAGGTPTLTVGANSQSSTFSGVIQNSAGSLALTKVGAATLTLSGSNTYSGGTTLSAGIISAHLPSALGLGPVTFAGGTRLAIGP